ncbi:MAG: hypothetical protein IIA50_05350 [Bacteroidetes bacterium]|nr:hypothetical protein [Bacteroidota bacterium]
MIVLSILAVVGCVYEKDVGADERSKVRGYVEEALDIEQRMTTNVGAAMEAEPLVWDESASADATVFELLAAYERYFASALPHISEAVRRWELLEPTETTKSFHSSTLSAFHGYELVMEYSIDGLRSGDAARIEEMLTQMDSTEAAMEIARQELDRLLEITD